MKNQELITKHKTSDVYGVRTKLILSYIERPEVDKNFIDALTDGNEVIVYGSSKQGKTSLILKNLPEDRYVKVECSPQTETLDIYRSVLRQLNVSYIESKEEEFTITSRVDIAGTAKIKVPIIGEIGASGGTDSTEGEKTNQKNRYIEYNLSLAQDISEILIPRLDGKYIILENFHYLSIEIQQKLAFDLRVFQDHGIIVIILGIWREANRLVQFNGDLTDRITEIPVEPWSKEDFIKVIKKGENLLNVDFSNVQDEIISSSFDSIGVVQELCKQCCLSAGITETATKMVSITKENLEEAIGIKTTEYESRHVRNFEAFATIARKKSNQSGKLSLAFPYYLVKIILNTEFDAIEQGISRSTLLDEIRKIHHRSDDVRSGDLGAFLHNITQHQISKRINPPFVDYDRGGKRLKIIDSSLYFFLRHCDSQEILADIPNPLEEDDGVEDYEHQRDLFN